MSATRAMIAHRYGGGGGTWAQHDGIAEQVLEDMVGFPEDSYGLLQRTDLFGASPIQRTDFFGAEDEFDMGPDADLEVALGEEDEPGGKFRINPPPWVLPATAGLAAGAGLTALGIHFLGKGSRRRRKEALEEMGLDPRMVDNRTTDTRYGARGAIGEFDALGDAVAEDMFEEEFGILPLLAAPLGVGVAAHLGGAKGRKKVKSRRKINKWQAYMRKARAAENQGNTALAEAAHRQADNVAASMSPAELEEAKETIQYWYGAEAAESFGLAFLRKGGILGTGVALTKKAKLKKWNAQIQNALNKIARKVDHKFPNWRMIQRLAGNAARAWDKGKAEFKKQYPGQYAVVNMGSASQLGVARDFASGKISEDIFRRAFPKASRFAHITQHLQKTGDAPEDAYPGFYEQEAGELGEEAEGLGLESISLFG